MTPLSARLVVAILLLGIGAMVNGVNAQTADDPERASDGDDLRVWLVTMGPGDAVWERYGHNAIRVLNVETGRDVAYNWGIFDFNQVDFIPRFLEGRMLYQMAVIPTRAMIGLYARDNREVILQELNLTSAQKERLQDLAETNALVENRDYIYQYFLDNCSTRIRDLLDVVLGGVLRAEFLGAGSGTSYRYHSRRLTQMDPLIYTGQDLLLGTPTDVPITVWEEMFLPLTLRDELRTISLTDNTDTPQPLVIDEQVVVESSRPPEPDDPPRWVPFYLALGVIMGGLLASLGTARVQHNALLRRSVLGVAIAWSLVAGTLGVILVFLLFTDHVFSYWNENLFLFHPLPLLVAGLLPRAPNRPSWLRLARRLTVIVAGIGGLGLLWHVVPASSHENAIFLVSALPAHLGLAWGVAALGRRSRRR